MSTIAAVLALLFIISGIVPSLHFGGGEATSSGASEPVPSSAGAGTNFGTVKTPNIQQTPAVHAQSAAGTKTPTPIETPSPTPPARVESNTSTGPPPAEQGPTVPPELDPGQPVGRLSIGALLLVLSIIGLIFTRRRRAW